MPNIIWNTLPDLGWAGEIVEGLKGPNQDGKQIPYHQGNQKILPYHPEKN